MEVLIRPRSMNYKMVFCLGQQPLYIVWGGMHVLGGPKYVYCIFLFLYSGKYVIHLQVKYTILTQLLEAYLPLFTQQIAIAWQYTFFIWHNIKLNINYLSIHFSKLRILLQIPTKWNILHSHWSIQALNYVLM